MIDDSEQELPLELYEEEEMQRIEEHIGQHFGPFDSVFHEIISPDIHVDIVIIPPRSGRDYLTLVTMGMGAHRMNVPEELVGQGVDRAELIINLPPDWKLAHATGDLVDADTPSEEIWYWPIRWLKILARLPGEQDTWLGWGHTIPTGEPLPGTDFRCLLLAHPGSFEDAGECAMPDGSVVKFFQLIPLYEEEMDYKLDNDANALLARMQDELLEVVDVDRVNSCADADPLRGIPFAERVAAFRDWFLANEATLSDMVLRRGECDRDSIVAFLNQGTCRIAPGINFTIGGDHELTFSVEGDDHLFFLYPRIVSAMSGLPPEPRQKWRFFPWMQGLGDADYKIDIFGVSVNAGEVLIAIDAEENSNTVSLRFFSETFSVLEKELAERAFSLLLSNCIGEGLAYRYIGAMDQTASPEDGMIPLTQLDSKLRTLFPGENGAVGADPTERIFSYSREAEEDAGLRSDIFMGSSRFMPLVNEYYEGATRAWRAFAAFGAKPVYLYYFIQLDDENGRTLVDERYEIQDALESELLNPEVGILLGGAMGNQHAYIEMLLFDENAFLEKASAFLQRFPYVFYLAEFRQGGGVMPLFDPDAANLIDLLVRLHDAGAVRETVQAIRSLPDKKQTYSLKSLLGRALNNMNEYGEALDVLVALSNDGETDPVWHWRIGYSLYFLNREAEAAEHFQRSIELGLNEEYTREFLARSLAEAEDRAAFTCRRASYTPHDPSVEPFAGFDWSGFWEDSEYAQQEYEGAPLTESMVEDAELELGYTLPPSYIWLMRQRNGGIPRKSRHPASKPTSWAEDHVAISGLLGCDPDKRESLCGEYGSQFMMEEWGYPSIGVAICDCPSAGHDLIFLDYRFCGPDGEPEVVHVDQENEYAITFLADDFENFIRGLEEAEEY